MLYIYAERNHMAAANNAAANNTDLLVAGS